VRESVSAREAVSDWAFKPLAPFQRAALVPGRTLRQDLYDDRFGCLFSFIRSVCLFFASCCF